MTPAQPILVAHRRNLVSELEETPEHLGIEVDIRSYGNDLVIHHDPFAGGGKFEDWVSHYRHKLLILNVKEEGLEDRLLAIMREQGIEDFFFLDQSFPFLMRTANQGENRCAVRVSEYESVDTALSLAGRVKWIWVDCFTKFPLEHAAARQLQDAGFKLCLVSPELQKRDAKTGIAEMRALLQARDIPFDAVCTKFPEYWR
jgi:hypothetical protein